MRGTSAHVLAVVAPAVVVGDEPGVGFGLELADRGVVAAVEGRAPALLEHGPLEALADGIVVGRAGRDPDVTQSFGRQGVDEGAGHIFAPVIGQDRSDAYAVTTIETQRLVDEAGAHGATGRPEHDGGDREAGEDVDSRELVHLAHPV
jgi:hypothetical protein